MTNLNGNLCKFLETVVARAVFTMTLLSISKACFHFKCSPDVASSTVWSRFLSAMLPRCTAVRQGDPTGLAALTDVDLRDRHYGACREAAASQALVEEEHPAVFT